MTTCLFVRTLADRVYGKKLTETHMAYSCLTSEEVDVGTHAKTHTQNKHSNPGLEKLSDDTAASITAKTFTLLFFNNPFIFLLSFLFILPFIFPLSWGRLSSETSSPQMVAVVCTPRVSTPKGTPDKTTFSIKMNESKVKRNRCTKKVFKKRIFHLSTVCLWDFSCLQPASLKRSYD